MISLIKTRKRQGRKFLIRLNTVSNGIQEMTVNDKSERVFIKNGYIRYIVPNVLAMIFGQLAPLVDSVCTSAKLGDTALSAFSTVSPVYYIFNIIAVLGGMGGGIGIAKASGAGEKRKAGRIFTLAVIWTSAVTILLSVLCIIFIDPILYFLCATTENFGYAKEYLLVLLAGMVFYVLEFAGAYILTDDNAPNLAMAGGIVMGIVNMIVDWAGLFIFDQGIWVTAFGTVFGAFCGVCVFLIHFCRKERLCRFVPDRKGFEDLRIMEIIMPGTPEALMYFIMALQFLSGNYVLSSNIGTSGLGNAAVIENLELIATIIIAGISEAVMPLAASYYGEHNAHGLKLVKRFALTAGSITMFPLVLSLLIYPQWLMLFLSIDDPVMREVLPGSIRIMSLTQLFVLVNTIFVNYLSSVDEEKKANISFVIQGIIQISLTLMLSGVMPENAPWYATFAANIAVILYFAIGCKLFRDLGNNTETGLSYITGGYASAAAIKEWADVLRKYLTEDQHETVCSKMLYPFKDALDPGKKIRCSFIILNNGNERSVVLRYGAKHDITGAKDDEDDGDEKSYGEVICSEFNFARRMMVTFNNKK